jgi:hypothetical protein
MTHEAWEQFVNESEARGVDPASAWWYGRIGNRADMKEVFVPVAFEDVPSSESAASG